MSSPGAGASSVSGSRNALSSFRNCIPDIKKAMEPLFTTKADKDRSGMGFTFMEAFMDELQVESEVGRGTTVHMKKIIRR